MLDIAGEKLSKLDKVSNKTNVISSRNKIKRLPHVSYPVFSHQSRFVPSQLSRFAPVPKAIFETTVAWRATQDDLFLLEPTRYLISYSKTFCNFDLLLVTRNDLHKLMAKIGLKFNKSRGVIFFLSAYFHQPFLGVCNFSLTRLANQISCHDTSNWKGLLNVVE